MNKQYTSCHVRARGLQGVCRPRALTWRDCAFLQAGTIKRRKEAQVLSKPGNSQSLLMSAATNCTGGRKPQRAGEAGLRKLRLLIFSHFCVDGCRAAANILAYLI